MNELPRGWALTDVASCGIPGQQTVLTGPFGAALGRDDFQSSGVPVLTIGCLGQSGIDHSKLRFISEAKAKSLHVYKLQSGDMLFSRMASVGRAGVIPEDLAGAIFNYHLMRLRTNTDIIEKKYLIYYIKGSPQVSGYLNKVARGATRDGINTGLLLKMPVLVAPVAEQRKITTKIDSLFAKSLRARSHLSNIQQLVEKYRAAVLSAAFNGTLTREWAKTHVSTTQQWRNVTWAQAGETLNGRAFPSEGYSSNGIRLLRPGNLSADGSLKWTGANTRHLSPAYAAQSPKYHILGSEILINLTAQSLDDQFLGRACLSAPDDEFLLNQRIALFKPNCMEKKYCLYVLKSPAFREFVDAGLNSGSLIQHVHTKNLARFVFPVAPREEQREIVKRVEAIFDRIDRLAAEASSARKLIDQLDQAILSKAFRGELVPQDPNDEPASGLLERIKSEQPVAAPARRGRGRPRLASAT